MSESPIIQNFNIKNNKLIVDLKCKINDTKELSILINNKQIANQEIKEKYHLEYPLTRIIDNKVNVEIIVNKEKIEKTFKRDIDSFVEGLSYTLLGKNNTFFLVNDENQEIRQHYDKNFKSQINYNKFIESTESKRNYLQTNDINYQLAVVPDKSVTLRKYLPFETDHPYRHTDVFKEHIIDLNDIIKEEDTLRNDTHISYKSSIKTIAYILSKIYDTTYEDFKSMIESKVKIVEDEHEGDLFLSKNWSYPKDELYYDNINIKIENVFAKDKYEQIEFEKIPEEFKYVSHRKSEHYINKNSILNKKALILHDSTVEKLKESIIATYSEVFFYWDHWHFNKDLVEWFKPDDVLEIRTERFLQKPRYPIVNDKYIPYYPVIVNIDTLDVSLQEMLLELTVTNLVKKPLDSKIELYIDDKLIKTDKVVGGKYSFKYPLTGYTHADHLLKIFLENKTDKNVIIEKKFPLYESLDSQFKGLKLSFKGKNNTFFRINHASNELLQHYDRMYKNRLDLKKFKKSFLSKKNYLTGRSIDYGLFAIADKSILLKDYIPFENNSPKRLIESLDYVYDTINVMDENDYLVNDYMLSMDSTIKLVAYMLNRIYQKKSVDEYIKDIKSNLEISKAEHNGLLFTNKAWSYEKDEIHEKYYTVDTKMLRPIGQYRKICESEIPIEFRQFSDKKSEYYINECALFDKKALILHDSSISPFIPTLIATFKEVFFYYDQWYFNKHLVDYFNPDVILEIREECTFENPVYPIVSDTNEVSLPITVDISEFNVNDNKLFIDIKAEDIRGLILNSNCSVFIDNNKILDAEIIEGRLIIEYDLDNITSGNHVVKISIGHTSNTKAKVISKKFTV